MVYFLQNSEGYIKIGSTSNLQQRLQTLQIGNSSILKPLYSIDISDEESLVFEHHVHGVCDGFRVQGEWFTPKVIPFLLNHPWYVENMKRLENLVPLAT